jgi:sigma-E factor negative regulatory protein RseB
MKRISLLLLFCGALATPAQGDQHGVALGWLEKMASSARKLNYTGTFTYQSGGNTETSRITHVADAAGELERIEVLDGSPREVIRSNDEIRCFLPDEKLVIVEKRSRYKAFPALLPSPVEGLSEYYHIRLGGVARVAGLDSQIVILEPKDAFRYGHQLWADIDSGLLLKARMVNERNETIEQFAFNQLQISGAIDRTSLRPRFDAEDKTWRIHYARTSQSLAAGGDWQFKVQLPGFIKSAGMKRSSLGGQEGEVTHFVFSDGLASISVFVEPLKERKAEGATYSMGATNVYKRVTGNHLLTVLGEVPMASLVRLGDGMELRKR